MTFQKIKVILFDVGGTLVHTIEPLIVAISMAFEQNGIKKPNSEEIIVQLGKSATKIIKAILPKELSNFEEKAKECISSFQEIFPNKVLDEFKAIEGVQKTLEALRDLDSRGPDCILICNNTLHKAYDLIASSLDLQVPVIHIKI